MQRRGEYYQSREQLDDLCVTESLVQVYDGYLLYPIMGDPLAELEEEKAKLAKLLGYKTSLVAKCQNALRESLLSWRQDDPRRRPWGLLSAFAAPLSDQSFMKRSRRKIVCLGAAVFRRYEMKYGTESFLIFMVVMEGVPDDWIERSITGFLQADETELDIWAQGFRRLFPTRDALKSLKAKALLKVELRCLCMSTDAVERLNSAMTQSFPPGAPGRNFVYSMRESLIQQFEVAHVARGGDPPLNPKKAMKQATERVSVNPLLVSRHGGGGGGGGDRESGRVDEPAPQAPNDIDGDIVAVPHVHGPLQIVPMHTTGLQDTVAGALVAMQWRQATCVNDPGLRGDMVADRPVENYSCLVKSLEDKEALKPKLKAGLSPFVLARNDYMHGIKEGRHTKLTEREIEEAHVAFQRQWDAMDDHSVYSELYDLWRQGDHADGKGKETQTDKTYRTMWGGGTRSTPLGSEELHKQYSQHQWPKDKDVKDEAGTESRAARDEWHQPRLRGSRFVRAWLLGEEHFKREGS